MTNVVEGDWKTFTFKVIEPSDHSRILEHTTEYLFYPSMHMYGYNKSMDEDFQLLFNDVLNNGQNLSFCALDKETGKVAAVRIISVVKKGEPDPEPAFKLQGSKDIIQYIFTCLEECKIFEKYDVPEFAELFGVSVDPAYRQQGLCEEMYRRAILLLKSRGFKLARCCFSSPYSRKAGKKNGFIELTRCYVCEAKTASGEFFNPGAHPDEYIDIGVFEIK